MKKKIESKFLNFIVVIILIVFVGVIYIVLGSGNFYKNIPNSGQTASRIYESKTLKFTINVPSEFQIKEEVPTVTFTSSKGEIHLDRSGTNFENLKDYLGNLGRLNRFSISNMEAISINTLPAISGTINGQKHYFIYGAPWTIYSIFTSSPALFGDLDKIAQSFKYAP